MKRLSIVLPDKLVLQLDKICEKQGLKRATYLRYLIIEQLKEKKGKIKLDMKM